MAGEQSTGFLDLDGWGSFTRAGMAGPTTPGREEKQKEFTLDLGSIKQRWPPGNGNGDSGNSHLFFSYATSTPYSTEYSV